MNNSVAEGVDQRWVRVPAGTVTLDGNLNLAEYAQAIVLFAHGSGSSRHSPRNRYVARVLNEAKLATLLIDLLTLHDEVIDTRTAHLRFDIDLLAERLVDATDWLTQFPDTKHLPIGYFGASTGEGGVPTWPARPCRAFELPRCSSSGAATARPLG